MKKKKITDIVMNILMYLFLVVAVITVILTIFSKKDTDGASELFGYQMRIVTSDSMAACEYTDVSDFRIKSIPLRSMVFVKTMPKDAQAAEEWYRSLRVGDVLTFRYVYTTQITITHRITAIKEKETGGFFIELAGDNKNSENGQLTQLIDTSISNNTNYVIGKVTGQAKIFGFVMSFLMQPVGMVMLVIVPCFFIILLEVLKIVNVFGADKKKRAQEEKEKQTQELDELRRRLAELEKEKLARAAAQQAEQGSADKESCKEETE